METRLRIGEQHVRKYNAKRRTPALLPLTVGIGPAPRPPGSPQDPTPTGQQVRPRKRKFLSHQLKNYLHLPRIFGADIRTPNRVPYDPRASLQYI
jgi:hypothetical protein